MAVIVGMPVFLSFLSTEGSRSELVVFYEDLSFLILDRVDCFLTTLGLVVSPACCMALKARVPPISVLLKGKPLESSLTP